MRLLSTFFVAAALAAACGTSQTTGDGGTPDGGATDGGPTPADGGGFCCPITGSPPCGCAGGGGWAASADQCPNQGGLCDAWQDVVTDSHGCPALASSSKCCGCPPPQDSGADAADASGDAATDATAE
jgi:hypothetical protein